MYGSLQRHNVPFLPTQFITNDVIGNHSQIAELFAQFGQPLVVKAPYTAFSKFVEKVATEEEFNKVAKRFFRRSDVIVVQKFCPTEFDWRVGVLNDQILFTLKYLMAKNQLETHCP